MRLARYAETHKLYSFVQFAISPSGVTPGCPYGHSGWSTEFTGVFAELRLVKPTASVA